MFACPEVTLCSSEDIKNQELTPTMSRHQSDHPFQTHLMPRQNDLGSLPQRVSRNLGNYKILQVVLKTLHEGGTWNRVSLQCTQVSVCQPLPQDGHTQVRKIITSQKFMWFSELRSWVKVEVAVLGSLSPIVLMVSVGVKQQWTQTCSFCWCQNWHLDLHSGQVKGQVQG